MLTRPNMLGGASGKGGHSAAGATTAATTAPTTAATTAQSTATWWLLPEAQGKVASFFSFLAN